MREIIMQTLLKDHLQVTNARGAHVLVAQHRFIVEFDSRSHAPEDELEFQDETGAVITLRRLRTSPRIGKLNSAAIYVPKDSGSASRIRESSRGFDLAAGWRHRPIGGGSPVRRIFRDVLGNHHGLLLEADVAMNENSELWKQWYLEKVGFLDFRQALAKTASWSPVKVAIFDSGIEVDRTVQVVHANLVGRKDRIHLRAIGQTGEDLPAQSKEQILDMNGHGTHICGIIGATSQNCEGMVGINPLSDLYIYKCSEGATEHCYLSNLVDSMCSFLTTLKPYERAVLNVSLGFRIPRIVHSATGGTGTQEGLEDMASLAEYLRSIVREVEAMDNVLIVAAAGNEFADELAFPANMSRNFPGADLDEANNVLAVGATDVTDNVAPFSNCGPQLSLVAPGKGILSTYPTLYGVQGGYPVGASTGYAYLEGTSMAVAIVTGLASLHWSTFPSDAALATGKAIASRICSACVVGDLESRAFHRHGFGLIQAPLLITPDSPMRQATKVRLRTLRRDRLTFPTRSVQIELRRVFLALFDTLESTLLEDLRTALLHASTAGTDERCRAIEQVLRSHGFFENLPEAFNPVAWGLLALLNDKYRSVWEIRPVLRRMIEDIDDNAKDPGRSVISQFQTHLHQCWNSDPSLLKQFLLTQYPDDAKLFEADFTEEMAVAFIRLSSDDNLVPITPYSPDLGSKNLKCW